MARLRACQVKIYIVKTLIFDYVVGPPRLVLEKKAFGSGLYTPWRGAYCYGLIFSLQSVICETPYCTMYIYNSTISKCRPVRIFFLEKVKVP